MQPWRIVLATLLAPATGPLIYCVGILLGSGYPYSGPGHTEKHLLSIVWLMALTYPVSIGLGVPIVSLLYFANRLTTWICIGWALVAGATGGSVFFRWLVDTPVPSLSEVLILAAIFAAIGGLTASTFCLIARPRARTAD